VDDTTEIIEALQDKFPNIQSPKKSDICYATQNRQDSVKALAAQCDLVLVVGSPNSSNSNRLREKASCEGINAYLIDCADDIQAGWFENVKVIGVTAGASAPEVLVSAVVDRLKSLGGHVVIEAEGVVENTKFDVPAALRIPIVKV
jgi:4-hydroxy-3-methylbut-2-enyl diphosphate reductase